jgi:predicted nucleotidyltransferase
VERDSVIVWPPDNDNAMSVMGFEEASLHALEIILPAGERVFVASPPGLLILKLIAWRERHWDRPRDDAIDLRALLDSYAAEWNQERLYEEADDLLQHFGYDNALAGAALLGRDAAAIAKSPTLDRIRTIVKEALADESFVLPAEMGGRTTDNIALLEALLFGFQDAALSRR